MGKKSKKLGHVDTTGLSPAELRDLLRRRLLDEDRPDLAEHLEKCAQPLVMQCACCSSSWTIEKGCKRRWCPVCAPRLTAERLMRVEGLVERFQWPLAVTLTRRNVEGGADCLVNMKAAFTAFRRTDFWADRVRGGIAGYEVTHRGRGWHPHVHALVDCRWLAVETPEPTKRMTRATVEHLCKRAQNELAEVWGAYVQGSKASVWVNRAWGKSLAETLKYAIKPSDLLGHAVAASEMIDVLDGGRAMTTFGIAHACHKEFCGRTLPEEHLPECERCGGFKTTLPADIIAMYHNRPDLAHRRFHQLMSHAGKWSDPSVNWNPRDTIPDAVPKNRRPSRKRAAMAAA